MFSSTHIYGLCLVSAHREVSVSTGWMFCSQTNPAGRRRLTSTEIDPDINLSVQQPWRVQTRLKGDPGQTSLTGASSTSNLFQFIHVVRNNSKKNGEAISSSARLTLAATTVQPLSHIQVEFLNLNLIHVKC